MTLRPDLGALLARAAAQNRPLVQGRVTALRGVALEVGGLHAAVGDLCTITTELGTRVPAKVVGFARDATLVMPLGDAHGIGPLDAVTHERRGLSVPVGPTLLGRVVDALGRPIDGGPALVTVERPSTAAAPPALIRRPIEQRFETGVAAIDGFLTCGKGQRVGIFAGSGVGKSTVLGMIARGGNADVNVIALIGERGREVREFVDDVLGPEGLARSVLVVATADAPPMLRLEAAATAVTIAEAFRDAGQDVLLMMDSITRFALAAREVGLAAGEPPTLRGYPPSLFALLPRLVERLGTDDRGSITGLLTVLVEGDDMNEPVADAMRGYLDGHIVLSRQLAMRGQYPAVDVLASVSRLMSKIATPQQLEAALAVRAMLARYEENRDLIQVGAYRRGTDPELDRAMQRMRGIEALLQQRAEPRPFADTLARLIELAGDSTQPLAMADR